MWPHRAVNTYFISYLLSILIGTKTYCEYFTYLSRSSLNKETLRCACSYKQKKSEKYEKPEWVEEHNDGKSYTPSQNIAPTDVTPVLISASGYSDDKKRLLKPMMWGIIPPWHTVSYQFARHKLIIPTCVLLFRISALLSVIMTT